jgi:hypothetical protein
MHRATINSNSFAVLAKGTAAQMTANLMVCLTSIFGLPRPRLDYAGCMVPEY